MSVNSVQILGRLGNDPELKYTPSGMAVCNLSVATSESWTDKNTNEKKEATEWHRVVVYGKIAELCNQYLKKGSQAYIDGSIHTRSWDDKDGNKKYSTEIKGRNVQFLNGSQDHSGQAAYDAVKKEAQQPQNYNISNDVSFATDDIPF